MPDADQRKEMHHQRCMDDSAADEKEEETKTVAL